MLGGKDKRTSLALLSGGGLSGNVEGYKLAGGSHGDTMHTSFEASSGLTMDDVAKQTTAECDKIHPTDVIHLAQEMLTTMKRTTRLREGTPSKGDVCVVLKVARSKQRGGELAILTFAGKDALAEFDTIHHPDVVEKVSPRCHHRCCRRQGQKQLRELPVLKPCAFLGFLGSAEG